MNTLHHIALRLALLCFTLLSPVSLAQEPLDPVGLPEGIKATGDTMEVRALTEWATNHRRVHTEHARQSAERALALARELNDQRGIGENSMTLGNLATDPNQAEAYFVAAREVFEDIGDEHGLNRSRGGMGNVYRRRGEVEQALAVYFEALEGFERLGDTEGQAVALGSIGNAHRDQGNLEEALGYYERAATLVTTSFDPTTVAYILNNFGSTLSRHGSYGEAERILRRALAISEKEGFRYHMAIISNNLGFLFNKQERFEHALPFLRAAERLSKELGDDEFLIAVYDELGKAYMGLDRYDRALHYAHESLVQAREVGSLPRQMEAHQTLSRIYEAAGDPVQALAHHRQYAAGKDSVFTVEKAEVITEMQTRYETEEKQRAIERLEQENQIKALQLTLLLAGVGGLLLILGVLFYRYRLKQRANRLLEELDAAKSRFFADISHEFRTPLTLLLGPLQDQVEGSPPSQETAEAMLRNAGRLERLVDQLLELERIDAGQLTLRRKTFDLATLVRESVGTFDSLAQQKHVDLSVEKEETPVPVHADAEHLDRVISNLLSNAVKFTPVGGRVRVVLTSPPPELVVEDTGPGVPPEWRERIFDRFAQMGDQLTCDGEGAGLGLALSRKIVTLHQGTLVAEEAPGGGARFVLRLPLTEEKLETKSVSPKAPAVEKTTLEATTLLFEADGKPEEASGERTSRRPRVLVVEDQGDLRRYIASILTPDYEVEAVEDGEEALNAVRREPPDVVVSDIVMPRRSGFALARALRAEPEYAGIPLIFLTARTGDRDEIEGLANGADQYLKKPFQRDVLLAHVAAALRTCRRLREHLSNHPPETNGHLKTKSLSERARVWVEKNIHEEDLSVEDMATHLNMSRTTLFRRLVAEAGLPPSEFIRTVRLTQARRLLETSAGNVSEVAYAVGFNSLAAFSRAYRAHFGEPPSTHLGEREEVSATSG